MNSMTITMGGSPLTMSSREIAELVEKRHDNVKRTIETLVEQGVIASPQIEEKPTAGRPVAEYVFSGERGKRDSIIVVAQLSPEFTARLVDRWQELEAKVQSRSPALPDFTNPAAAARAWADQVEARELAERTKAEIGSRREATAMNTAAQATKRANKLAIELDRGSSYATVKRMAAAYPEMSFSWRELKRISQEMGAATIDVFDANYGTVKGYPADVWQRAYGVTVPTALH